MDQVSGLVQLEEGLAFCLLQFTATERRVLLQGVGLGGAMHGDLVSVRLFHPSLWRLFDTRTQTFIPHALPHTLFSTFVAPTAQTVLDCLATIHPVDGVVLVPVGQVLAVLAPATHADVTGYTQHGLFFPDNKSLPVLPADGDASDFRRVRGSIDRRTCRFVTTSEVDTIDTPAPGLMDDSGGAHRFTELILPSNTPLVPTTSSLVASPFRFDLTSRRVFTVDSAETSVRDDALHVLAVSPTTLEVGVHCVDLTDAVEPDSELFAAAWRGVVSRENNRLFPFDVVRSHSLDVAQIRPVFSVLLVVETATGQVVSLKYGRTTVKVRANMTFGQFDAMRRDHSAEKLGTAVGVADTTLPELLTDVCCVGDLVDRWKKRTGTTGSDVVRYFGDYVNRLVGEELHRRYGPLALVTTAHNKHTTHFRSSLRRFFDMCVLRQVFAMSQNMDDEDMIQYVCGQSRRRFLEIKELASR